MDEQIPLRCKQAMVGHANVLASVTSEVLSLETPSKAKLPSNRSKPPAGPGTYGGMLPLMDRWVKGGWEEKKRIMAGVIKRGVDETTPPC